MSVMLEKWRGDKGSIDFVQLIVGLMIIGIASVGTLSALSYGYGQLNQQMRHRKAIEISRSWVEYLQGRLHCDFDKGKYEDAKLANGTLNKALRTLLDDMGTPEVYDDVYCKVSHGKLVQMDLPETSSMDWWEIYVKVEWAEPDEDDQYPLHKVEFFARMVPEGY